MSVDGKPRLSSSVCQAPAYYPRSDDTSDTSPYVTRHNIWTGFSGFTTTHGVPAFHKSAGILCVLSFLSVRVKWDGCFVLIFLDEVILSSQSLCSQCEMIVTPSPSDRCYKLMHIVCKQTPKTVDIIRCKINPPR